MPTKERRGDARIDCRISLNIRGEWTDVNGMVADISRSGFRLHLPLTEIGLQPGASLSEVSEQLHRLLTDDTAASFLPEMLGQLVTHAIWPRRLSIPTDDNSCVELAGTFDKPLTASEAAALGLPIPMENESIQDAKQRTPLNPPKARTP